MRIQASKREHLRGRIVEKDHARLLEPVNGPMPEPERIPTCRGCSNKDRCRG